MSDPLLSNLCGICHNNEPKYRCPRCSARTCSMPCYKRHQQWSECSGKRDPAAYKKRSELATPTGIDHDYNFLTGVERVFDRADQLLEDRKIGDQYALNKLPGPGSNYHRRLAAAKVTVDHAPTGMSRQRNNSSRYSKKTQCLIWTVEWIHPDQSGELDEARETTSISQAYTNFVTEKARKLRKRKRGAESKIPSAQEQSRGEEPTLGGEGSEYVNVSGDTEHLYFYLVKPRTSSSRRVLIPLSRSDTIGECLKNQVVLEFPTVQVLPTPPEPLTEDFELEASYLVAARQEEKELNELLATVGPQHVKDEAAEEDEPAVDDRRLSAVLKQDIGSRT